SASAGGAEWLFVVNQEGASITVIDGGSSTVAATIEVPPGPAAIAYWPEAGQLFVTHPETGQVSVVDPAKLTVTASFRISGTPFGIAIDPSGRLLITDWSEHCVHVLDAATGKKTGRIDVGQSPAGIVLTATHAYVANRES